LPKKLFPISYTAREICTPATSAEVTVSKSAPTKAKSGASPTILVGGEIGAVELTAAELAPLGVELALELAAAELAAAELAAAELAAVELTAAELAVAELAAAELAVAELVSPPVELSGSAELVSPSVELSAAELVSSSAELSPDPVLEPLGALEPPSSISPSQAASANIRIIANDKTESFLPICHHPFVTVFFSLA
jgi:hypothetical protein